MKKKNKTGVRVHLCRCKPSISSVAHTLSPKNFHISPKETSHCSKETSHGSKETSRGQRLALNCEDA